jgi:riboflavin kinase/FMN adenylyltransferase
VHQGHRVILDRIIQKAKSIGGETVLLTFDPHPRMVIGQGKQIELIQTLDEKIQTLSALGIDNLVVVPFTLAFAAQSAEEYIRDFLVNHFHPHTIIIGYDHQFGNDRKGNIDFLIAHANDFNYDVIEIPAEEINEVNVSSTKIRTALQDGSVEIANAFLNKPFELSGTVIKGEQLGRTIGFPTANLDLKVNTKLIPANGVYAVKVQLQNEEKPYFGMMNIGYRPTVSLAQKQSIEIYLFDFQADLYEAHLKVSLYKRIRKEEKFVNLATLKSQLSKDEALIRSYFTSFSKR